MNKKEKHPAPKRRLNKKHVLVAILLVILAAALTVFGFVAVKWWPVWKQNVFYFLFKEEPEEAELAPRPSFVLTPSPSPTPLPASTPELEPVGPIPTPTPTPVPTPVLDDWNFADEDTEIHIEEVVREKVRFYVADVKVRDAAVIGNAFANDKFGDYHEKTSVMAQKHDAVFAMSGDYCGFRDEGIIIRDGVLYRDNPDWREVAVLFKDGTFTVYDKRQAPSGEELVAMGAWQSWAFGPYVLKDGVPRESFPDTPNLNRLNPRAALGIVEPNHFVFIVVDGRCEDSEGMTLVDLGKEFLDRGCTDAYNLDGGGSATMYFNGRLVNSPLGSNRQRAISDIIYIAP